jgi:hypothetical protein
MDQDGATRPLRPGRWRLRIVATADSVAPLIGQIEFTVYQEQGLDRLSIGCNPPMGDVWLPFVPELIAQQPPEVQRLRDFIEANLRRVIFVLPEKELEVQNAIESLIIGRGMAKGTDYDRETGRVKTSGKESVPDFIFPNLNLCLEVKLARSPDKVRSVVDEVNADIRAYSRQYERQVYVVYDLGFIRDEAEYKRDFETAPGVSVVVIKH